MGTVAEIQSMFHQFRVEPKDCDALRFLWWPGGDLSAELAENQMFKYLLGVTSSVSIVNLCLKETAEMGKELNSEVANVIKRNCMGQTSRVQRKSVLRLAIRASCCQYVLAQESFK